MRKGAESGYVFGLAAALCFAIVGILVRSGLSGVATPLVGVTLALSSGTLTQGLFASRDFSSTMWNGKGIIFLLLSGLASGVAATSYYFALDVTPVVIVAPLTGAAPLVTLFCAHLFLQRLERITWRIVFGTLLVVFGVIVITMART